MDERKRHGHGLGGGRTIEINARRPMNTPSSNGGWENYKILSTRFHMLEDVSQLQNFGLGGQEREHTIYFVV
jgi:hypothetical protein